MGFTFGSVVPKRISMIYYDLQNSSHLRSHIFGMVAQFRGVWEFNFSTVKRRFNSSQHMLNSRNALFWSFDMKLISIISAAVLCATPNLLLAQDRGNPMDAAKTVDACNGATVTSAVWQDDGRLAVTCPRGSVESASGAGATNFLLPGIIIMVVAAAAAGGGGSTSDTN